MADEPWLLKEDGYLNVDPNLKQIIYHQSLNVILICAEQGVVHVLDVNSGVVLQSSRLSAAENSKVTCRYLSGQDRVLFCDGYGIGVRSDYNGVLLLDTILQKPVANPRDVIKLELLLSEAILLKQNLILMSQFVIDQQSEVINELCDKITEAQKQSKKGIKAQKWNTVCLELPLEHLKRVAEITVSEFTLKNQHVPELAVAAAVQERLNELLSDPPTGNDRSAMASEARRRETFSKWPHMDYKWALPDQMAQAGFYHQPNSSGDDRAMCFTCTVCLVCWERTDEPWSEHERHSPSCPFVMGEYTQNVPLSVTYATAPALDATYRGVPVQIVGASGVSHLIVTSSNDGLITVYDIQNKLKRTHSFYVTQYDSPILENCMQEFGHNYLEDRSVSITSLTVIGEPNQQFAQKRLNKEPNSVEESPKIQNQTIRPTIVCGLTIKQENCENDMKTCLCLVVYDYSYTKDLNNQEKSSNIVISMINDDYNLMESSNSSEAMTFINDMKMFKNSDYQNLIPGETDEIFLPPSARVLIVEEPDACSSIEENKTEKSISDHISELKSSKNKKLNYSHAIQCVSLPELYKNNNSLEIFQILPTRDGSHVIVVLRGSDLSVLLLYQINFGDNAVKLHDTPAITRELPNYPIEVSVIPSENNGSIVIVCSDGIVRIFEVKTLKQTSIAQLENEKFVSAVYCNSLERLCAATSSGSLHFYSLNSLDPDFISHEDDEEQDLPIIELNSFPGTSQPKIEQSSSTGQEILNLTELRHLHELSVFEPLSAQYCVVVPPCWSEMQQAQRQRRHPQYLSGEEQHTRTWRLQTDTTTWDEHIFELTLPWPVSIGHIDVHFSLHGQHLNPPHVEVTLLRQNTSGIGHRRTEVNFQVDETVSFECLQRNENPVTFREYLRSHNADILAGPINLGNCLDLSEQNGCVTLTSPKLFKTNTRTLLLHIKALCDPSKEQTNIRKEFKRNRESNTNLNQPQNKIEYYMGCDCLHELSITIYKAKNTDQKIQRTAMLESNQLLSSLLKTCAENIVQKQSIAFDVLIWIASIRLARNRSNNGESPNHQLECLKTIEQNLQLLFKQCLLNCGRSIARKCVKLVVICSEGARNISDSVGNNFDNKILQSLIIILPEICKIWSAGALHWLVVLILRVTRECNNQILITKCVGLLREISLELNRRTNIYHLLLRSRFGLYGTPLEPELFDIDPPVQIKPTSVPVTYASVIETEPNNYNNNFIDFLNTKDVFIPPTSENKGKMKNLTPNKHIRGLLETEPLHFVCISASDGTRVERFDPNTPPVNMSGLFGPVNVPAQNAGTKKADSDELKDKENVALTELDLVACTAPKDIPKQLTQLLLNADIQKANNQDWPILSKQLDVLEMSVDDEICPANEQQNCESAGGSKGPNWGRADHMELLSPQLAQCSLQQLLVAPPQQVMVVEQMQSGARRFVTLDFGAPVLLTDVIIPACHDLVSLSLDLWLRSEDSDAVRLVLATDIGSKTLVLSDLQPPPICRYIKITTIGRYGMSTTRCKIPIGNFYGHIIILPDEIPIDGDPLTAPCLNLSDIDNQVSLLAMLLEDVSCRYSLACSRLKDLLHPLITGDIPNSVHMAVYMSIYRETNETNQLSPETSKIFTAYHEALMYQKQLNIVQAVIKRIEKNYAQKTTGLQESCTDKLRVIAENLLDIILSLNHDISYLIDRESCEQLFQGLCVSTSSRLQTLSACLLVKTCGKEEFWGNFISDMILKMYSSTYTQLFPLDRVFVLLNYIGKQSPERALVLDANMRILVEKLTSFSNAGYLLAVNTDLSLLGWILLFLSWQLDHTFKGDSNTIKRWIWVTGDTSIKTPDAGICTGSQRRKVHRRFIHYKQQIDQLDWTKKAVQASTQVQALSALSSQAASLSSKLEAALKQQENVFKRIKQISSKQKEILKLDGGTNSTKTKPKNETNEIGGIPIYQILDMDHSLTVARAIVSLLLAMDHSCSADLFLLACKVLARLVVMSRLPLHQILSVSQLQHLMRLCVRGDQPWAQHAVSCLLLDFLDVINTTPTSSARQSTPGTSSAPEEFEEGMDTSETASTSWGHTDTEMFETFNIDIIPEKNKTTTNPLPSVFESDDSELDDFLDDILERGRSLLRRNGTQKSSVQTGSISSAMDARLELGVETSSEILLRRLTIVSSCNLQQLMSSGAEITPRNPPNWPQNLLRSPTISYTTLNNFEMLTNCFNNLFCELQNSENIEHTIRLWLTLNKASNKGCFNPTVVPTILISQQSVNSLISALTYSPNLSLRSWCVCLQALTLICNIPNQNSDWLDLNGMTGSIVSHPDIAAMLMRLLSGNGVTFSDKGLAGPSVCKALHDLLIRLLMRCDVITTGNSAGIKLKQLLLQILYQLVQVNGPLASRQGPLDVQCKFLQSILHLDYSDTNLQIVLCILESIGVLISSYVSNVERIKCVNLGERHSGTANNFSGLFASVLGSDSSRQDRPASWESLLIALLKLLTRLVQTPLPVDVNTTANNQQQPPVEPMDTSTSLTDEFKSSSSSLPPDSPPAPCLADTALHHHASIIRFLHALSQCSSSSLAMLMTTSSHGAPGGHQSLAEHLGEPATVGDAVFQLLSALANKTSRRDLVLEPMTKFLKTVEELSEPIVWWIIQVLDNEEMLQGFFNLDGIRIICDRLVRTSRSLTCVQHGTVSLVMHHVAQQQQNALALQRADATLSYATPSFSKKVQQANLENAESLVNFAPMGSIRCHSGTAQPADVLIQSAVASHRRARTPQWCYHFYPDETHTDLTIRLPSAVLLREVQLQPHLSSLSTCPSFVALEISNGSPDHLVPASPPLATSGMTFIRLHLPVPEVVTHVLLRLYKPRDASNIGLSQIRLLGTSAFGKPHPSGTSDVSEEEQFTRFSLGWLRLLHHSLHLSTNPSLSNTITSVSSTPDLLQVLCSLLQVPTHIPTLYLPHLERVLCKLSLHSREAGLQVIRTLLNSRAAMTNTVDVMERKLSPRESVCEVINQVCGYQDQDTPYRVSELLQWLSRIAQMALTENGVTDSCSSAFISCIASVLWSANSSNISYTLQSMVSVELFDMIYQWSCLICNNIALKNALDCLLCSLCYIKNELFPLLLEKLGVLVRNSSTDLSASISDDRKDSTLTDDTKENFENQSEWYERLVIIDISQLILNDNQLSTIAMTSRSPQVIQQLLDSGLPRLLIAAILDFCSNKPQKPPMAHLQHITSILNFLYQISGEKIMKDWLGNDGATFWLPLLQYLCNKSQCSENHASLEEIVVKFLSKVCLCHENNQKLLAKVLCDVIGEQFNGISGFLRRLILQLLLENEKIIVCIKADESIYKISSIPQQNYPLHPNYKRTHDRILLHLNTNTTIGEILEQHIAFATTLKTDLKPKDNFGTTLAASVLQAAKEIWEIGIESDHISMAAGVTAKDKRAKDVKNQSVLSQTPQLKKKRYTTSEGIAAITDSIGGRIIRCESFPEFVLPAGLTLAQLLGMLESHGKDFDVHLTISHSKDDRLRKTESDSLLQNRPIGNALQVFSTMGGLALLAQHLPTIYPEIVRPPAEKPATNEQPDTDWVKVEGSDDIYEDLEDIPGCSPPTKSSNLYTNVPSHSLTAFGLFLRLPGYAEVLLKDVKKALCLLRLVLGVTDDGEGTDIFMSSIADSLPTLPFEVLRQLYDSTPLGTDDGRVLRSISINIGVTNLLLSCLAVFTHQIQPNTTLMDCSREQGRIEDKSQLYWAKGTGFGTGSTQQSWNVEQALLRQRSEEEHVTVLLQVLASYINPGGNSNDELADPNVLPATFEHQLSNSCLLPALSSYLRNDSVLDMARHIPLYRSVLQLLRAMAVSQQLINLLLPRPIKDFSRPPSIVSLLQKMKSCVDNYTCRLRFNKNSTNKLKFARYTTEPLEETETDEGLALLMPDIQETANLVEVATSQLLENDENEIANRENVLEKPLQQSLEQRYLDIMKRLQFDTFEMITESPDGYKFVVSYHFEGNVRSAGDQSQPARVKRLAQEAVTLATSLPLSYSSSVFVRCDTDRLDIMKVLITGPADTPYANGCFELDVYFPPDYPNAPMLINLETTGHHTVRFNPNLYNDGKVCLSVLNTWHGRPEEKWNAQTSSFLQVLVSIQSLILVPEPYFNEPGYERSRGTPSGTQSSKEYNLNICQATVRWAMLEQILNPCACFKQVIHTHFWLKKHEILAQIESWIQEMETQLSEKKSGRSSSKRTTLTNLDIFKKNYHQLKDQLMKLKAPEGVEESGSPTKEETLENDVEMEKIVNDVCE